MHSNYHLIPMKLALFDGAAAGAADAGAAEAVGTAVSEAEAAEAGAAEAAEAGAAEDAGAAEAARREAYLAARREYGDLFEAELHAALERGTDALRVRLEGCRPVLEALAARYGLDADDAPALADALTGEDALRRQRAGAMHRQAAERLESWSREGAALRARYPAFDLRAEARDPQFVALLRAGLSVEQAFRARHAGEILALAVRQAAERTEKRIADHVRARGRRPAEAGLGAQTGVVSRSSVSRLTREDRAAFARRAMQGENISF